MRTKVLLVEDTATLSTLYETVLARADFDVGCAFSAAEARTAFAAETPPIVVLDLMLPDGDGLDVLRDMRARAPDTKVIVVTANGSVNLAVSAMQAGAFDFLVKPFEPKRLLNAAADAKATLTETVGLGHAMESGEKTAFKGFIGKSQPMLELYNTIGLIGRSSATVFITGESGTGKEVCAQAIHEVSGRRTDSFVPLNCGAIPPDLLEPEVFGHLKGSFTGAVADKVGAAVAADRGTLFLDEICEMDLALQTKLLRFIQTGSVQPVGATRPQKVDVRILCATNRNPREEVAAGRFREDLFYRLHVVPLHLEPLRNRDDDVNLIAERMLRQFADEEGKAFRALSEEVRARFRAYDWPGNVRELLNVLRNVVVLNDGALVEASMLPGRLGAGAAEPKASAPHPRQPAAQNPVAPLGEGLVGRTLAEVERHLIEATLAACDGSIPQAARMLDVSPSTLYRKRDAWSRRDANSGA